MAMSSGVPQIEKADPLLSHNEGEVTSPTDGAEETEQQIAQLPSAAEPKQETENIATLPTGATVLIPPQDDQAGQALVGAQEPKIQVERETCDEPPKAEEENIQKSMEDGQKPPEAQEHIVERTNDSVASEADNVNYAGADENYSQDADRVKAIQTDAPEQKSYVALPGSISDPSETKLHASEHTTPNYPAAPQHNAEIKGDRPIQVLASGSTHDRHSSLLSPLTHPNGVNIFPSLSTAQQEQMSWEALTQAEQTIVADTDGSNRYADNMSDGGYESEGFSSGSTSAESCIRDYMYENGRRYHRFREGTYNFPNDDVEQEREDMKHAMVKLLCGQKLHFAPIGDNPQEVLDIGTGTGIWVIEMGDQYPSAHVVGIDLSPIQPDWLPPNVRFIVDDAESPWLYPRNHFDYVHSRHTVMAIKDWTRLFRRAFEHIKPGGWIELQEIHHFPRSASASGELPADHPVAEFWSHVTAGLAELGVDLNTPSEGRLARMLQDIGFVNVTERVLHVPIGTWPKNKVLKTVGLYWRTILLDGLQAIALGPMTRGLRWKREEVEVFLTSVRTAYQDNAALMYMPLHVIYAQKPMHFS